jgi:hypothetical protein
MKKFFILLFLSFIFIANASRLTNNGYSNLFPDDNNKAIIVKISEFKIKAGELVGKTVVVTGIVDHVCKHGGKKLFLVDESSDASVKITTGENMASFTQNLIGETVEVTGVVEEMIVDEDYINDMEMKIDKGTKKSGEGIHLHNHENKNEEGKEKNGDDQMEKVNKLREMLSESKKDHLSFYSVKASSYKVIK